MDSAFFLAHTARARAEAGWFTLMGRKLRPLSALHAVLIAEQFGEDAGADDLDFPTLEALSLICSARLPVCDFENVDAGELAARIERTPLSLDEERVRWRTYWAHQFGTRPRLVSFTNGSRAESNVPAELYVVTALLMGSNGQGGFSSAGLTGCTWRELWEEIPVAELLWRFEAMREQRDGRSYIATEERPPETEAERAETALAGKILARHFGAVALASGDRERIAAANAERDRLLALLESGRLADDLTELPSAHGDN